jgi:CRISPR system Cascade subunit CasD
MNTLFLRLEGPLQSWGVRSRWDPRDTSLEPTKSGVVGLLACALGWGRDRDDDLRNLSQSLTFGVRIDRPGRLLRDYQTVFGGVMSAGGKIKVTQSSGERETVVSPRQYLADASFLAVVQGSDDLIERLAQALQNPHWPLYLGRKSCPPAVPPFDGVGEFDALQEALERRPRLDRAGSGLLRASIEVPPGEGARRQDQIDTLSRRTYLPRYSRDVWLNPPAASEE